MSQADLIQDYLLRMDIEHDQIDEHTWVLHDDIGEVDNVVIRSAGPLVIFSVRVMDIPSDAAERAKLFHELLHLNGSEMLAGAYGTNGNGVIINEILQGENLDFNEFQAAIDGLTLAITEHYPRLKCFHTASSEEG